MSQPLPAQASRVSRDQQVQWLQQNAASIRSLDPADTSYADLEALGRAIGSARVVMLGEQSHGDGAVFLAKTRIIRYLHEKLGFDVLAFESGFYDVPKAWELLRAGEMATTAVPRGVFGIWTGSRQFTPLIDYIGARATAAAPLEITGFDNQFTASASTDYFMRDLRGFLGSKAVDTTRADWTALTTGLESLVGRKWHQRKPSQAEYDGFRRSLATLTEAVKAVPSDSAQAYWAQLLRSVDAYAQQIFLHSPSSGSPDFASGNVRDQQMAENLLWLAQKRYPTRRIIVWAATFHIMRNQSTIRPPPNGINYAGVQTMGNIVTSVLGPSAYTIGFIASQGSAGTWSSGAREIPRAEPESLEGLFASTKHENAFVDFRKLDESGAWLGARLVSGPLGYARMNANWTRVLDGMVYTRRMTPSTRK